MPRRILIIQGHPHTTGRHFCHAIADAYAQGAEATGNIVRRLNIADMHPGPMQNPEEFHEAPSDQMLKAQDAVRDATHLVFVFPIWLGTMPAMLKAFLEQLARNGFALGDAGKGRVPRPMLKGRSARVIATMGMPAFAYRLWFLNGGIGVLKRAILGLCGVSPVRQTTIGSIEAISDEERQHWLTRIEKLGRSAR